MTGRVEVPTVTPILVPPFGVIAKVEVVVAHLEVEPPPDPQAAPAAETAPVPSTCRHLVAPVPVFEIVRPVVEAKLVTFRLVVVEKLANRLVVDPVVVKNAVVVALVPMIVPAARFPTVVDPETKRLPAFR